MSFQVVNCWVNGSVATDPHFANTILLLSGDGAQGSQTFTDESFAARGNGSVSGTDTKVSTAEKVFGTGSIRFDTARNDVLSWPDHADWTFGSSDFTIEGFFYHEANTATECLVGHYNASTNNRGWMFQYRGAVTPDNLAITGSSNGTSASFLVTAEWTPTVQTFYYYCAERSGDTFRIYAGPVGGTAAMLNSATSSMVLFDANTTMTIGSQNTTTNREFFAGNVEELRITLGVARYATDAGFPVPTAPFPRS